MSRERQAAKGPAMASEPETGVLLLRRQEFTRAGAWAGSRAPGNE